MQHYNYNFVILDADVEDNLESDTSRCYKSLSDSTTQIIDSPANGDQVLITGNNIHKSASGPDSTGNHATFNVETNVENHLENTESAANSTNISSAVNGGPVGMENGPSKSEEITVSYTFANGHLSENSCRNEYTVENNVDTNVTFTCSSNSSEFVTLCNGEVKYCNDRNRDTNHVKDNDCSVENGIPKIENGVKELAINSDLVNGDIDNKTLENGVDVDQSVPDGKVSPEANSVDSASLTDLTSEVSTLSLGDSTGTLASDISRLTLKDEVVDSKDEHHGSVHKTCNGHDLPNGDIGASSGVHCRNPTAAVIHMSKQNKLKDLHKEGKKKSINTLSER